MVLCPMLVTLPGGDTEGTFPPSGPSNVLGTEESREIQRVQSDRVSPVALINTTWISTEYL